MENQTVTDYMVVDVLKVKEYLPLGWILYGNPFYSVSGKSLQALVKIENQSNYVKYS